MTVFAHLDGPRDQLLLIHKDDTNDDDAEQDDPKYGETGQETAITPAFKERILEKEFLKMKTLYLVSSMTAFSLASWRHLELEYVGLLSVISVASSATSHPSVEEEVVSSS